MSSDQLTTPAATWDIRSPALDTWFPILAAAATLLVSGAALLLSPVIGMAVCAALAIVLCIVRPMDMPIFILAGFLFQNLTVAFFSPAVTDASLFNVMRGMNFVMLAMAFAGFTLAALTRQWSHHPHARRWVVATIALAAVIAFYLLLGMVRGQAMDAVVYFRNTITPVACFFVGFLVVLLYRFDSTTGVVALGVIAAVYGYCELFFTLDFLSLFNGDSYVTLQMRQQIESGYWERVLHETGFVLRGLGDTFMTNLFNLPLFADIQVWRITGPNFHPISYAYALSIISVVLLSRGQWLLALFLFPLLLIVGSKGALVILVVSSIAFLLLRYAGPRLASLFVVVAALGWIGGALVFGIRSGDYHVLGFLAGVREFLTNPLGEGLGIGGNLSSDAANLNWNAAQASGASEVPVESAVGVMLYQMGIGSFAFFGLLFAVAATLLKRLLATSRFDYLAGFAMIVVISANAVLQEEAYYSPLALGLVLLVSGGTLARAISPER